MVVKQLFAEEFKNRQAERDYTPSLSQGQRYVMRELRLLFNSVEEADVKAQINLLESTFRGTITRAVIQELNRIRRNGITGQALIKVLGDVFYQHNMRDWIDRQRLQPEEQVFPIVICSEGLG
jgi:hypothetical protein